MPEEPVQIITQVAYYGRVPEPLLLDPEVGDAECRLYAVLTRYDWRQSHEVWPTWDELGKRLNWSRAKVARVLGLLVARGAVETRRKGRRPNLIILRADTLEVSELTPQESLGSQFQPSGVSDPANAPLTNERKNERARAATRIPDEFIVTDAMAEWATEKCPSVDWDYQTEKFCDHWRSKGGKEATKLDWTAAWRLWMRRSAEGMR